MSKEEAATKLVAMLGMSKRDAAKMLDVSTPEEINTLAATKTGDDMRKFLDAWADNHPKKLPAEVQEDPTD